MTLEQVMEILEADMLTDSPPGGDVGAVCASDLLSDILAFTPPHALLLTGLVSPQTVRTADLVDATAVCFVAGMSPQPATVALARTMGIPLAKTSLPMFEACGRLYAKGLRGGEPR